MSTCASAGLFSLVLVATLSASEPIDVYPLWDGSESVASYAKRVNLPAAKSIHLGGGITLDLTLIPAGRFTMGTPVKISVMSAVILLCSGASAILRLVAWLFLKKRPGGHFSYSLRWLILFSMACALLLGGCAQLYVALEGLKRYENADIAEQPAHTVTLTRPFYMGVFEVTQDQYQAVMGANPSKFRGGKRPVESVTQDAIREFCENLKKIHGITAKLPNEAQWEFACRAGTMTAFNTGNTLDKTQANFGNSAAGTVPAGSYQSNSFGLFDMHGNVSEYCILTDEEYSATEKIDPAGSGRGEKLVQRGGTWSDNPKNCRSAQRIFCRGDYAGDGCGFRVIVLLTN